MEELSKSQKGRTAIATFKTLADALILRGSYKPSGTTGMKLENALRQFSPEIYGSMVDLRIIELKGLEYVIDRLPRGVEQCNRIVLTAQEDLDNTSFEQITPLKRRRLSYVVSEQEICFVVTRGTTEIYDLITHLTFINIEAQKIYLQACQPDGELYQHWQELTHMIQSGLEPEGPPLDKALWNLSIILGRTYKETKESYEYLQQNKENNHNSGLFKIVHSLGQRIINEKQDPDERLTISFTPSLQEILGHHRYATLWAESITRKLKDLDLLQRPVHIISANLHSVKNLLFGRGALQEIDKEVPDDIYEMIHLIRDEEIDVAAYAENYGFYLHHDQSGSNIDVQIVDARNIDQACIHESIDIELKQIKGKEPVIIVIDYAFGTQAFEVMDELLSPTRIAARDVSLQIESISVMGKAGILPGKKGDIMLATAHVMEGTPHNYIVNNDLSEDDFNDRVTVYSGPMVTVLGTSLQNRDVLERFHESSWKAIGLEMEGGHYQRAISAAIIQGHIPKSMKIRYAYYASDNPLISGQTLASGPMGLDGVVPTYLISKVILEKILSPDEF